MQPVQINQEQEPIESLLAEYEAVKIVAASIAEQNALVLKSIQELGRQQVAQSETLAAMFGALVDAIKTVRIDVHVPEQPAQLAPVVNLPAPIIEVKPPQVKLTVPKVLRTREKIQRHKDSGLADTSVTEYEYEK